MWVPPEDIDPIQLLAPTRVKGTFIPNVPKVFSAIGFILDS
jgi:hypothetical protein